MKKLSRKSKSVSWLPGVNLCQVRLFLSEEPPSKVGLQAENHPKMRSCTLKDSNFMECTDLPPPGFGGNCRLKPLKDGLSVIPRIKWKCPPKFILSNNWGVATGEESLEAKTQQLREIRVLEAVYPRPSAIPSSSAVSLEADGYYDDSQTPVIPLIPFEQEEPNLSELLPLQNHSLISSHQPAFPQISLPDGCLPSAVNKLLSDIGVDLAAIVKSKDGGNLIKTGMIDPDLLLVMLSNPQMVGGLETLINKGYKEASAVPTPTSNPVTKVIPESGLKPAGVLEPLPENGKLHHIPVDSKPVSNSMMRFSPPSLSDVRHLAPMSASVHQVTGPRLQAEPSLSTSMTESVKVSIPSFRAVEPRDTEKERVKTNLKPAAELLGPLENGKLHHIPVDNQPVSNVGHLAPMSAYVNQVTGPRLQAEPSLSTSMTESVKVTLPSIRAVKPNLEPDYVPHTSGMMLAPPSNVPIPATDANSVVKDMNYFKNLIREHGMDKKETQDRSRLRSKNYMKVQELKLREGNSKFQKPCIFFNRPNGCRNGFNCPFVHAASHNLRVGEEFKMPAAKRMKLI